MKSVIDNSAGPTGLTGIIVAKWKDPESIFSLLPSTPSEWLIFFSTGLVLCQLIHWGWRFLNWYNRR